MKEMVQRQKESVNALGIVFPIKQPLFALLVRHSEWILNHPVRNDFLVEVDVVKTSPHESHTGSPAPRSTPLLNRILLGRRDDGRQTTTCSASMVSGSDWRLRRSDCFASRRSTASSW